MEKLTEIVLDFVPMTVVIVFGAAVLAALNRWMDRRSLEMAGEGTFRRQMAITFLALFFVVAILVTAPLQDAVRGNLISLFGIAITGVIALSSTTLASRFDRSSGDPVFRYSSCLRWRSVSAGARRSSRCSRALF